MSHFTVAVITESPDNLEKLLVPYQENNMDDCPKEFMEFNNVETEYRRLYETDFVERIKMPDGSLLLPWDEKFRKQGSIGLGTNSHEVPAELERVEIPLKETYPTFEQYIENWCGYKKDEELGKYGYWENPNKKWDWYTVGGRWQGLITLKDGKEVDYAQFKDIEFKDDFGTYAVITPDGKWHSKGEMGWWGFSSESKEEAEQFNKTYHESFIANANPEHYIIIVDCHI